MPSSSDSEKTAESIVSTLLDIGLENVAGTTPVYFNIDETFLLHALDSLQALPPEMVYFEILEAVHPTEEVIAACRQLKSLGYRLALDDVISVEQALPFMEVVDVVKVDWMDTKNKAEVFEKLRKHAVRFLAEKVDSYETIEAAKQFNVDYYQGFFFCKPKSISASKLPESKVAILRAMQRAMEAVSIDDMFDVVKQDVTLSYRLLKYINSAAFSLRREVESVEQALSLLGINNIRRWLTLLSMTSLIEDKPGALIYQALWRARFLESLARQLGEDVINDDFLLGLFSILDALLDRSMQDSLKELRLARHVYEGLVDPESPMGKKLAVSYAIERGDWDVVKTFTEDGRRVSYSEMTRMQAEAMHWADEQLAALNSA